MRQNCSRQAQNLARELVHARRFFSLSRQESSVVEECLREIHRGFDIDCFPECESSSCDDWPLENGKTSSFVTPVSFYTRNDAEWNSRFREDEQITQTKKCLRSVSNKRKNLCWNAECRRVFSRTSRQPRLLCGEIYARNRSKSPRDFARRSFLFSRYVCSRARKICENEPNKFSPFLYSWREFAF